MESVIPRQWKYVDKQGIALGARRDAQISLHQVSSHDTLGLSWFGPALALS